MTDITVEELEAKLGQVRVVEELSRIEGTVGWLSMISTAGSFLAAFLEAEAAQELFGAPFVSHFAASREREEREFRRAVTDWELARYFEII